jgi:hypothetical protein
MARSTSHAQREFRNRVAKLKLKFRRESIPFWALIVFLGLIFFTGGASRSDVQSLIILRPAAVIFCGIGLWSLRWEHVKAHRFLFGMAAAIFALVISHLIPLPPALWGRLPGRGIITEIDRVAELGAVWRPLSMVPSTTWNSFYSLFAPLAVLIFGAQLGREERFNLLPVVIGLGLLSAFWGILQIVGPTDGPLYLYADSGNGAANGLFANHNHQAALLACLFPMLAVYSSTSARSEEQHDVKLWMAIGAGIVLVPVILITGSRAGLALGILGIISALFMHRRSTFLTPKKRAHRKLDLRYALVGFTVLCLGALSIFMSRAQAFQRLFGQNQVDDERFKVWVPIAKMAWKYFPFGSGLGTFVEVYQIDEPHELLSPEYYNHAHNDWLEVYLTAGLLGLLLLAVAFAAYGKMSLRAFQTPTGEGRAVVFGRLAAVIIAILALASIPDYPLRTPSLMSVFVVVALWLSSSALPRDKRAGST